MEQLADSPAVDALGILLIIAGVAGIFVGGTTSSNPYMRTRAEKSVAGVFLLIVALSWAYLIGTLFFGSPTTT